MNGKKKMEFQAQVCVCVCVCLCESYIDQMLGFLKLQAYMSVLLASRSAVARDTYMEVQLSLSALYFIIVRKYNNYHSRWSSTICFDLYRSSSGLFFNVTRMAVLYIVIIR
jgi:hypothetical protein